MAPPQQRFHGQDAFGCDLDDRLVGDLELAPLQRSPQLSFVLQPLQAALVTSRVEDGERIAAVGLGPVKRNVGGAQEILRGIRVRRRDRDADGALHDQVVPADREGTAQRVQQRLGDGLDIGEPGDLIEHGDKLIATEPGQRSVCSDVRGQPARDGDEEIVAGRVADTVVDDLEPVEIEEEQRHLPALGVGEDGLQLIHAHAAIG